jgi:hypothetical protein
VPACPPSTRARHHKYTYGATVSYFSTSRTAGTGLFAPAPITASANGKPNSNDWIFELDSLPFMNSPAEFAPWAQTKLSLQYVACNKLNPAAASSQHSFCAPGDKKFHTTKSGHH